MHVSAKIDQPAADVCEIKVGDTWETIRLDAAKRAPAGSLLRCPACGGRIAVHGAYSTGRRFYMQHRRTHAGCKFIADNFRGNPSRHPDALT